MDEAERLAGMELVEELMSRAKLLRERLKQCESAPAFGELAEVFLHHAEELLRSSRFVT